MKTTKNILKTEWDLTTLYKNVNSPEIDKDLDGIERVYTAFEKKYKTKTSYMTSEHALYTALSEYEKISD